MDFLSVLAPEALASEDESASEALASEAGSPCWDVTAAILGEIQAEADAHRVPVIFLLVPWHFPVLDDRLVRHVRAFGLDTLEIRIDQPNDFLGERLRAIGLDVLDPLPWLRAAADRGEMGRWTPTSARCATG